MKKSFKILALVFVTLMLVVTLASCKSKKYETAMNNVSLLIDNIWSKNEQFDKEGTSLGSFVNTDFEVPYEVQVEGEAIAVEYSITGSGAVVDKNNETKQTNVVVSQTSEDQKFTLTVNIEKVDSKSWEFNVDALDLSMEKTQAEIDAMNPLTYEQYAAAKSGEKVLVQGWITHPHEYSSSYGNASVWLQDENGGYYAYRVKVSSQREWDTYFKVGNKIAIEGVKSPFNGWDEFGSGSKYYFIKDAQTKNFEAKDVTSIWGANKPNSVESKAVQNQLVKVTAKVASIDEYNSEDMYLGLTVNGQTGYLAYYKDAYVGTMPKDLFSDLQIGYTIEITGMVSVTKSGAQICPMGDGAYTIISREVTDADRVAQVKNQVLGQGVEETYYASADLDLLLNATASDKEVTVTYALQAEEGKNTGISLVDGKQLKVVVDGVTTSKAKLVATIKCGEVTDTAEFDITVKTDNDVLDELVAEFEENYDVPAAFLAGTVNNITYLPKLSLPGATLSYELEENAYLALKEAKTSKQYYLQVVKDPDQEEPLTLKLTATIKYDNPNLETEVVEKTIVKDVVVRKEAGGPVEVFYSYTKVEEEVTVSGFIAYLGEFNEDKGNFSLYLADAEDEGGYYGYQVSATKEVYYSLKVGTYVTLEGEKGSFNNGDQIAKAKLKVAETDKTYEATAVTITAESLADANWVLLHQADFVTVTGTVESVEESWNGRSATLATLKVGDQTIDVSINTYIWNNGQESGTPVWNKVQSSKGMQVTVSGYLARFNAKTQINVVNSDDYVLPEVTVDQKVDAELNTVKGLFESTYLKAATVNLPSKGALYTDVTIAYELVGTYTTVAMADGKLTINPTTKEEVSLHVKATCGETVKEATIKFTVDTIEKTQAEIDAMDPMTYEEYAAAEKGDAILVQGWITHPHDYSSSYGNGSVWLQDENGGYYAYRVKVASEEDWNNYFKVGNKIAVVGKKSPYNGWDEIGSGCSYYFIKDAQTKNFEAKDVTSIWGANVSTSEQSKAVQNQLVKVTAVVGEIPAYDEGDMYLPLTVNVKTGYQAYYKDAYVGSIPENLFSDLKAGYTIEITGIVSVGKQGAQICTIGANAYKVVSTEVVEPAPVEYDALIKVVASPTSKNMTEGNNAANLGVDESIFNITAEKGDRSIFPGLNSELRLYGGDGKTTNGNSIKVAVTGKTIAKIVINFGYKAVATASITGHDNVTITTATTTTVEYDTPVTEFVIKNITDSTNQVCINSIEVYFAE